MFSKGDKAYTSYKNGQALKGEIKVTVLSYYSKQDVYLVQYKDEDWLSDAKHLNKKSRWADHKEKECPKVFLVECFENDGKGLFINQGIAATTSSLDKAIEWIKKYGEDWVGGFPDESYYTITAQEIDGNALEYETFGKFDGYGKEIK